MICSGSQQILAAANLSFRRRWWTEIYDEISAMSRYATSSSRTTTNRTASRLVCAHCCTSFSSNSHTFSNTPSQPGTRMEASYSRKLMSCGASYSQRHRTPLHGTPHLDALDECRDRDRSDLIAKLARFHKDAASQGPRQSWLKFIVTSRPYDDIQRGFDQIPPSLPAIRLRG